MIYLCPFCGNQFENGLRDGIADCSHCHRIFNSSKRNHLLSAAWTLRKNNLGLEQFAFMTKLSSEDALFVYTFVADNSYSHDEFQKYLKDLGVTDKII